MSEGRGAAAKQFLGEAARVLALSLDYEATIAGLAQLAVPTFADWCFVDLVTEDGDAFDRVAVGFHLPGGEATAKSLKRRYPVHVERPVGVALAIQDREPRLYQDLGDDFAQAVARDADHLQAIRALHMRSAVVAPMLARGKPIGALSLLVSNRNFDETDLGFVTQLAHSAAAAIDNARLFESERRARIRVTKLLESERRANIRLRVLAQVGETLSMSLGLDETLQAIAHVLVPALADWCVVDLVEGRAIRRVATVHQDPAKVERARRVSGRYQPQLGDDSSIARVIAAGKAHFYPQLEAKLLERAARDEDELELLRGEGLVSTIMIPLKVGGACIGALSLTTSDSGRVYDEADAEFAAELGRRAGTAIESSGMRRELEAAHDRMHHLFMQAPMSIAIYQGAEHVLEFANPTFLQVRGRGQEAIGRKYIEIFPESYPTGKVVLDRAFLGEPQTFPEVQTLLDRGRGPEEAFFHVSFVALKDAHGQVDRVMSVSFEVTDRVLARRALDRERTDVDLARREAEAASRAKDDFLAMLGHELRNPLAPITTALNLMELRGIAGAERERSVITRQVQHLTRLVNDLLDVSRIIRGKVELAKETVELSELVSRGLETASPLFEQRNQYVEAKVPRRGLLLDADPTRMAQAFSNLFTNAAKYTNVGGHITVTAEPLAGEVILRVSDDGVGIAKDRLVQIFELFVQEQQAIDRARGGLGLGLAIVKSVITLHGGSVSADSLGTGRGSVFSVRLPLLGNSAEQRMVDLKRIETPATGQPVARRVLVVDDNEDAAEMLGIALRAAGHVTMQAHDGPSALSALLEFPADVALLDLGLPAMDGYELAAHIRAARPDIRLVALTGYGQESDRERTRAAGFHEHLVKPAEMAQVLRAVSPRESKS